MTFTFVFRALSPHNFTRPHNRAYIFKAKEKRLFIDKSLPLSDAFIQHKVWAYKNDQQFFVTLRKPNVTLNYHNVSNLRRCYSTPSNTVEKSKLISEGGTLPNASPLPVPIPADNNTNLTTVLDVIEPTTTNTVSEAVTKIGDLKAMGLVHYTPVGALEAVLEATYVFTGLPWWATIVTTTFLVRLVLFPFTISGQRNAARLAAVQPYVQQLMDEVKRAHQDGDSITTVRKTAELQQLFKDNNVNPFRSLIIPLIQLPFLFSFFMALRDMASLPVPGFQYGGTLWFTDLTARDPYYALPILATAGFLSILEFGTETAGAAPPNASKMKFMMRIMSLISIPLTSQLPAATLVYFTSSTTFSLVQFLAMKNKRIRQALNIPRIVPDSTPQKSVYKQFKELNFAAKKSGDTETQHIKRKRRRL